MKVTGEQRLEYFQFVAHHLGGVFEPSPYSKVIANLTNDGQIAAAVVYDITRCDAQMSVASDGSRRWITKQFLRDVFLYPFVQLGLQRVTVMARESNHAALAMNLRLGFVPEGRLRKYFGDEDGILLGMLRSECRHLGENNG